MRRLARSAGWLALLVLVAGVGCATTGNKGLGTGSGALGVGDPAPPISIAKWIKGSPVSEFEEGKVYVVEFWATWCRPCVDGMPHLAEIQHSYGDKVQVIGVSSQDEQTVSEFLQKPHQSNPNKSVGEVADYTLALDNAGKTNNDYMAAANVGTIPNAFIVGKDGLIKYIGHPGQMDAALRAAVNE